MSADGHINIYSLSKFKEQFDEEIVESFIAHFRSAKMYTQELEGKFYITRYWGDNLYFSDTYDVVHNTYDSKTDSFNECDPMYNSWEASYFKELSKPTRAVFKEMTDHLETECKITHWEVWT